MWWRDICWRGATSGTIACGVQHTHGQHDVQPQRSMSRLPTSREYVVNTPTFQCGKRLQWLIVRYGKARHSKSCPQIWSSRLLSCACRRRQHTRLLMWCFHVFESVGALFCNTRVAAPNMRTPQCVHARVKHCGASPLWECVVARHDVNATCSTKTITMQYGATARGHVMKCVHTKGAARAVFTPWCR